MFKIGAIVAIKSHPYFLPLNQDHLIIAGDAQSIPPLMVVVEMFEEFIPSTGNWLVQRCKCMWYSQKMRQFDSIWFLPHQIDLVPTDQQEYQTINPLSPGTLARFKTTDIELGKKKSSIEYGTNSKINTKSISSLLYFVSPVLQIIEVLDGKRTETGKVQKKRCVRSSNQIKCKFFNPDNNKFSEIIMPFEAVDILPSIDKLKIETINNSINLNGFLKITPILSNALEILIKPTLINYRSGLYYLEAFNFVTGKNAEYILNGNEDTFTECDFSLRVLPSFTPLEDGRFQVIGINRQNLLSLDTNYYWRITYQDNNQNITERTIHSPVLTDALIVENNNDNAMPETYVKAFCMLRSASRHFKLSGIKRIIVLNIQYNHLIESKIVVGQIGDIIEKENPQSTSESIDSLQTLTI